jgi:hypothetical protein
MDWSMLSTNQIELKLKELNFPSRFDIELR